MPFWGRGDVLVPGPIRCSSDQALQLIQHVLLVATSATMSSHEQSGSSLPLQRAVGGGCDCGLTRECGVLDGHLTDIDVTCCNPPRSGAGHLLLHAPPPWPRQQGPRLSWQAAPVRQGAAGRSEGWLVARGLLGIQRRGARSRQGGQARRQSVLRGRQHHCRLLTLQASGSLAFAIRFF